MSSKPRYKLRYIALSRHYQIWDAQEERWAEYESGGIYTHPRRTDAQDYLAQLNGTAPAPRPWQTVIKRAKAGQNKEQNETHD